MKYKNCTILRENPPIPGIWYSWAHADSDGAPEGNDTRCGIANSIRECKKEIDRPFPPFGEK